MNYLDHKNVLFDFVIYSNLTDRQKEEKSAFLIRFYESFVDFVLSVNTDVLARFLNIDLSVCDTE